MYPAAVILANVPAPRQAVTIVFLSSGRASFPTAVSSQMTGVRPASLTGFCVSLTKFEMAWMIVWPFAWRTSCTLVSFSKHARLISSPPVPNNLPGMALMTSE